MNSRQLKDKVRNLSKEKNVDFNTVFRLYIYDRFLERLAVSNYRDNFILKGGFYLSSLFGVENRATMDIDTSLKNTDFSKENINKMLEEIISININDNANLELASINTINDEDEYGGYRATILIKIENIRESFHLDIATGDTITPSAINYKYLPTLSDNHINLWAYNIETVLAEKLETTLIRGEANSRMRDFYDIYLIYKINFDKLSIEHLKLAIKETFENRNYNGNPKETFNTIKNSDILSDRWKLYSNKNQYARDITFAEIIKCLSLLIDVIK